MTEKSTSGRQRVPIDHIRLLLSKAEDLGLSAEDLLLKAKLSLSAESVYCRVTHISQRDFIKLRDICLMEIRQKLNTQGDRLMSNADFEFMCHSLISSTDLREVTERLALFYDITSGRFGELNLSYSDDRFIIVIKLGPIEANWEFFFIAISFSFYARLFCWLIGEEIAITYETSCSDEVANKTIASLFNLKVDYSRADNRMLFHKSTLNKTIVRTATDLREYLQQLPYNIIIPPAYTVSLKSRIEAIYLSDISNCRPLSTLEDIARALDLSGATLRRHLSAEDTSIRQIKEKIRKDLAGQYIINNELSLSDIAERLNFSSEKTFTRAFCQWYGITPAAYRHLFHH